MSRRPVWTLDRTSDPDPWDDDSFLGPREQTSWISNLSDIQSGCCDVVFEKWFGFLFLKQVKYDIEKEAKFFPPTFSCMTIFVSMRPKVNFFLSFLIAHPINVNKPTTELCSALLEQVNTSYLQEETFSMSAPWM